MEETILLCEDTLEGVFTGVFQAYLLKKPHEMIHIQTSETENYALFSAYQKVPVNQEWSERVVKKLQKAFGDLNFIRLCRILVSPEENRADILYHIIVYGLTLRHPETVFDHLANAWVLQGFKLGRNAEREIQHMKGFLRFEEFTNGVLFSKIAPKGDLILFIAEHFADRFPGEDFIIFDEKRNKCMVHPKFEPWYVRLDVTADMFSGQIQEERELFFQALFQEFCDTIGIKERYNKELQRGMLPLYFRHNMVEFKVH